MSVTLIIPAFNESSRLVWSLPRLRQELGNGLVSGLGTSPDLEVIVVDDGSTDGTADVAARELEGWEVARVVRLPWNQGKGGAVKAGVAMAQGDATVVMDADLSADLGDLPHLLRPLDNADIVLGSRMAAGSRVTYLSPGRRASSRIFNALACLLTGVAASDTQCGFKAFRSPVAKLIFHLTQTAGFAMDVEMLALAQLLGCRVVEVPIGWVETEGSRVRPVRDAIVMMRDVYRARRYAGRAERLMNDEWLRGDCGVFIPGSEPPADLERSLDLTREQHRLLNGDRR